MALPLVRELAVLCMAAATFGYQPTALAWGDRGHRIIAAIAYEQLLPEARRQAAALLAEDKDNSLTARDFVSASTWADALLQQDRLTLNKSLYNGTRFWHFAEFELDVGTLERACYGLRPLAPGRPASRGPAKDCVVSKVEQFAAELRDPATERREKILALKFLLHLVGDLHQPLHVVDNGDVYGHAIKVRQVGDNVRKRLETTLHEYWDDDLVELAMANAGETDAAAARRIASAATQELAGRARGSGPREWLLETVEVARNVVYDFSGQANLQAGYRRNELYVNADYEARATQAVMLQLAKAGFRLAGMLNEALAIGQAASRP